MDNVNPTTIANDHFTITATITTTTTFCH